MHEPAYVIHESSGWVWSARHAEDIIHVAHTLTEESETVFYEKITPSALMELLFSTRPEVPPGQDTEWQEENAWVAQLANRYGWDTPLYRADYARPAGSYTAAPISRLDAAIATLEHFGARVYPEGTARYAALLPYDGQRCPA